MGGAPAKSIKWLFVGSSKSHVRRLASGAAAALSIPYISSGTLLREAATKSTPTGKLLNMQLRKGILATSETVVAHVMEEIRGTEAYTTMVSAARKQRLAQEVKGQCQPSGGSAAAAESARSDAAQGQGEELQTKRLGLDAGLLRKLTFGMRPIETVEYKVPPKVLPYPGGFILEGFPRTADQAAMVDALDETDRGLLEVQRVVRVCCHGESTADVGDALRELVQYYDQTQRISTFELSERDPGDVQLATLLEWLEGESGRQAGVDLPKK